MPESSERIFFHGDCLNDLVESAEQFSVLRDVGEFTAENLTQIELMFRTLESDLNVARKRIKAIKAVTFSSSNKNRNKDVSPKL